MDQTITVEKIIEYMKTKEATLYFDDDTYFYSALLENEDTTEIFHTDNGRNNWSIDLLTRYMNTHYIKTPKNKRRFEYKVSVWVK